MRNIRIGVVEDDPASCQLVLDYLNRYQQENDEQFTVSVFDDGARIVEKYTPVYDILLLARIQFVSATLVFGLAAFDCSLAISSSHTSLGVL